MPDQQGTSFKENMKMVFDEFDNLITGQKSRVAHKLWNVVIELIRAYPKITAITVSIIIFVLVEWIWSGNFL